MGISSCCTKPILILVNLIFFLAALTVLILGIIVHVDIDIILDTLTNLGIDLTSALAVAGFDVVEVVESSSVYLIVIGVLLALISMCGLFGACCESRCLLILYIVTLSILLVSQITMVIVAIVLPDKFQDGLEDVLFKVLKDKFKGDMKFDDSGEIQFTSDVYALGWANFQIGLECCGSEAPDDYNKFPWNNTYVVKGVTIDAHVPASCCNLINRRKQPKTVDDFENLVPCLTNSTDTDYYYKRGCVSGLVEFIDQYKLIVIGVAAGIAAFQVLLIIFAVCICRDAGRGDKTV